MSEEKRILDFFGVSQIEGNVRGEHFGKLLTFLKINTGKRWDFIMRVSPLILGGMQRRYIRENYLEGLLELGIIRMYCENNIYYYKWLGESALNGSLVPSEPEKIMNELDDLEEQSEEQKNDNKCPNCGKELKKDKKFCNQKCVEAYYLKEKKDKK